MNVFLLIVTHGIVFAIGYITAQYWGKPAREWKKLEQEAIDLYAKAKEKVGV